MVDERRKRKLCFSYLRSLLSELLQKNMYFELLHLKCKFTNMKM